MSIANNVTSLSHHAVSDTSSSSSSSGEVIILPSHSSTCAMSLDSQCIYEILGLSVILYSIQLCMLSGCVYCVGVNVVIRISSFLFTRYIIFCLHWTGLLSTSWRRQED